MNLYGSQDIGAKCTHLFMPRYLFSVYCCNKLHVIAHVFTKCEHNLASKLAWSFWHFTKLQWLPQTSLYFSPVFPVLHIYHVSVCNFAHFPLQSSVFSSSWGFTDIHMHFTHLETPKASEETVWLLLSHHKDLEQTQERGCACVKGREITNKLRLHPRQNSYSLPETSGFAYLKNSHP